MAKNPPTDNKSEQKWTEQFRDSNLNWKTIYTNRLSAIKEIKLQNFQYKFLMRNIPSNTFQLKCKIATSALCDFCEMEIETINHLFWECLHVQQFWAEIASFLKDYNVDITFNQEHIRTELSACTITIHQQHFWLILISLDALYRDNSIFQSS